MLPSSQGIQPEPSKTSNSCYDLAIPVRKNMKFLLFISNAFINTMGITQPSPRAANRAAWVIAAMLFGVILCVTAVAVVGLHLAIRH